MKEHLKKENLKKQDLGKEELKKEDLKKEDLKKEDLKKEELKKEDLKKEDLKREDLKKENLKKEDLKKEDLKKQDLKKQDLKKEDLKKQDQKNQDQKKEDLNKVLPLDKPNFARQSEFKPYLYEDIHTIPGNANSSEILTTQSNVFRQPCFESQVNKPDTAMNDESTAVKSNVRFLDVNTSRVLSDHSEEVLSNEIWKFVEPIHTKDSAFVIDAGRTVQDCLDDSSCGAGSRDTFDEMINELQMDIPIEDIGINDGKKNSSDIYFNDCICTSFGGHKRRLKSDVTMYKCKEFDNHEFEYQDTNQSLKSDCYLFNDSIVRESNSEVNSDLDVTFFDTIYFKVETNNYQKSDIEIDHNENIVQESENNAMEMNDLRVDYIRSIDYMQNSTNETQIGCVSETIKCDINVDINVEKLYPELNDHETTMDLSDAEKKTIDDHVSNHINIEIENDNSPAPNYHNSSYHKEAKKHFMLTEKNDYLKIKAKVRSMTVNEKDEKDYRFHAAHLDRGLTIHEAVPGGFNRAGEGL